MEPLVFNYGMEKQPIIQPEFLYSAASTVYVQHCMQSEVWKSLLIPLNRALSVCMPHCVPDEDLMKVCSTVKPSSLPPAPESLKIQVVRLELKSDTDPNNPEMKAKILEKVGFRGMDLHNWSHVLKRTFYMSFLDMPWFYERNNTVIWCKHFGEREHVCFVKWETCCLF